MKRTFKSSNFFNISSFHNGFFEIHQRFKGHFLNELRVSFNNYIEVSCYTLTFPDKSLLTQIMNSEAVLTESEKSLLCKGLNFAIPPKTLEYADYLLLFELLYL